MRAAAMSSRRFKSTRRVRAKAVVVVVIVAVANRAAVQIDASGARETAPQQQRHNNSATTTGALFSISYLGTEPPPVANWCRLLGLHVSTLNKLDARFDEGLVPRLPAFLAQVRPSDLLRPTQTPTQTY